MRACLLLFSFVLFGCDRGPAPAEPASAAATPSGQAEEGLAPSPGVHGGQTGLPPGHPPTPEGLPPGHPPTATVAGAPTGVPSRTPQPSSFDPAHPSVGGVTWTASAPLVYRVPSSSMRVAEYVVSADADAVMTVFYFPGMGGTVDANIERWVGQFSQPDGSPSADAAEIRRLDSHGLAVTLVDVSGNFGGGMGAPPQVGQRLLGAIVEASAGPVFFKLIGPSEVVGGAAEAFEALAQSVAPML